MAEENNNIEELLGSEENLNKAIAIIKGKSFAVMPIKDFNEQEQNLRKDLRKEIGSHFGAELSEIDIALSEHLGIDKEGNEKTNAFIKRVIPTLKTELDTLKKAKEDGLSGSESLKAERDSLLEKLNTSAKEKEELENSFKTTLTNKDKEFIVNAELSKLTFKEGIADIVLAPAKKEFINSVLSKSTLEEGKLVFKDEGVTIRNDKNEPITVFELASKEFINSVLSKSTLEEGKLVFKDEGVTIRNDKNEPITVFELASKEFESVLSTDNVIKGLGNGDNTNNNSKSSLSLFAAGRKPTNFGEAELTIKAYYESKGERIVNGSKKMLQGLSELRAIYKF